MLFCISKKSKKPMHTNWINVSSKGVNMLFTQASAVCVLHKLHNAAIHMPAQKVERFASILSTSHTGRLSGIFFPKFTGKGCMCESSLWRAMVLLLISCEYPCHLCSSEAAPAERTYTDTVYLTPSSRESEISRDSSINQAHGKKHSGVV